MTRLKLLAFHTFGLFILVVMKKILTTPSMSFILGVAKMWWLILAVLMFKDWMVRYTWHKKEN